MKKLILSLAILCSVNLNAQEITTLSSCDSNGDGNVTVNDVTNTTNKLLGKVAAEKQVVTAEDLNATLTSINNKLSDIQKRLMYMEKSGVYTFPFEDDHAYVDLGLSVKWATCNIGATSPEEYGLYFAWGETTGYTSDTSDGKSFDWANYKWYNGTYDTQTKYCTDSEKGTVDNLTTLESSDDAAYVNWGSSWRMPTDAELTELMTGCYWEWTSSYNSTGVAGYIVYKVKSDSDKGVYKYSGSSTTTVGSYTTSDTHIFLPAASYRSGSSLDNVGSRGYYWSSSLSSSYSDYAYCLYFDSSYVDWDYGSRYCGPSVRPVCQ